MMRSLRQQVFGLLVTLGLFLVGLFNCFSPTFLSNFSQMQSEDADTRLNHYFLEYAFQFMRHPWRLDQLFSPAFFYPFKNVLAFSDNLFGSAPIYMALRMIWDPDLAYQIWMLVVTSLCFFSFWGLLRYYRVSYTLASMGGFLFAFGMPRIGQIYHQQLLPQFFTPLAFLFLWEFLKKPARKWLALSLLLIYWQLLAGIYLGWFLILTLGIFLLIVLGLNRSIGQRLLDYVKADYKAIIPILVVWMGLMFGLLHPYLEMKALLGGRSYAEVDVMVPRLQSWLMPLPGSLLWQTFPHWVKGLPMAHEHFAFFGVLPILMVAVSLFVVGFRREILGKERSLLAASSLLTMLVLLALSLRLPNGWSLWYWVYQIVPGASVIRAVARIWTMVSFLGLLGSLLVFDTILDTMAARLTQRWKRTLVIAVLCLGAMAENLVFTSPSVAKAVFSDRVHSLKMLMTPDCDIAYVALNPEDYDLTDPDKLFPVTQMTAVWAGLQAHMPVINGYSGNIPPGYGGKDRTFPAEHLIQWLGVTGNQKQLCVLSQQRLELEDPILQKYARQDRQEISGHFWNRYLLKLPLPQEFAQEILAPGAPGMMMPGETIRLPVIFKNTSSFVWSPTSKTPTHFAYRWLDNQGKMMVADGLRSSLPFEVAPGERVAVNVTIQAPTQPGRYRLLLTMVQESVAWFSDVQGGGGLLLEVEVR
jgi:hypothetical protein